MTNFQSKVDRLREEWEVCKAQEDRTNALITASHLPFPRRMLPASANRPMHLPRVSSMNSTSCRLV